MSAERHHTFALDDHTVGEWLRKLGMRVAVVIPAYKVSRHIAEVVNTLPIFVDVIYVVDDACPEQSGARAAELNDPRVRILWNQVNSGVGGAVIAGYRQALHDGFDILVKVGWGRSDGPSSHGRVDRAPAGW